MPRLSKAELDRLFPYETFPIRMEWKDGNDTRVAWFQCHEHMQKMYDKVKKPRVKIDVRYKYPDLKPEEKSKRKVTTTKKPASKKPAATKKAPATKQKRKPRNVKKKNV